MARILLDTTYLLPALGIGVGLERFEEAFPRLLEEEEVLYNPLSLVEAKWICLRLSRRRPDLRERLLSSFVSGLRALLGDERLAQVPVTSPDVEELADLLLARGVRDYFDRMVYASAVCEDAALLTEDEELLGLEGVPRPREVLTWSDVLGSLSP